MSYFLHSIIGIFQIKKILINFYKGIIDMQCKIPAFAGMTNKEIGMTLEIL